MQVSEEKRNESFEIGSRNFESIIQKIDTKKTYEKALRQASKKYEVKNFKVLNMTPVKARRIYPTLVQKYQQNLAQQESWLQNQRRLFIWVVICYIFVSQKSIAELTIEEFSFFSTIFNNKKQDFLKFQIFAIIKRQKKLSKWTFEEDHVLKRVISEQTNQDEEIQWNEVSKKFFQLSGHQFYRSSKHCRERWMNHLDINKMKGLWTHQQDIILLNFVKSKGKKWSLIVKELKECKTEHMVKNRFNSLINKKGKILGSKNEQKIINKLLEQLYSPQNKCFYEQYKTQSKAGQPFIGNKSECIKQEKSEDLPNIFQNDNSLGLGIKCKFSVQRVGSLSMSERGGVFPQLANPILEQMDSEEERSKQRFLISTPISERGGQMRSPFLSSPLMAGNGGNITPSMFSLEQNGKESNNPYSTNFNMSFSSNFDKFVPQQ